MDYNDKKVRIREGQKALVIKREKETRSHRERERGKVPKRLGPAPSQVVKQGRDIRSYLRLTPEFLVAVLKSPGLGELGNLQLNFPRPLSPTVTRNA